jgi:hypothetical protein
VSIFVSGLVGQAMANEPGVPWDATPTVPMKPLIPHGV